MSIPARILFILLIFSSVGSSRAAEIPDTLGTLTGRVVDTENRPVAFANIIVLGTRCGAQADEKGQFMITLVPPGRRFARILYSGIPAVTETLDVAPGANAPLAFRVPASGPVEPAKVFIPGPRRIVSRGDLVAEIVPVRSPIKVYETPSFQVRIWNRSQRPIVLVICNRGSGEGRSPTGTFEIAAPFDAFGVAGDRGVLIDSPRYEVLLSDFIEVEPGQYFEPFDRAEVTPAFGGAVATRPGHYGVTFRYSTSESDVSRWVYNKATPELLDLLSQVPVVDLEAKATFKVDY